MKRALALVFLLGSAIGLSVSACSDDYTGGGCCKKCSSGKPCGDSCIASGSQCNAPPGCACYGYGDETDNASETVSETETSG